MKRKIAIGIIAGGLICAAIFIPSIVRNVKFNKAVTLIESGNYAKLKEGIEIFETIKEKNENRIEEYSSHYIDQLCEQNEYNSASEYVDLLKMNQILSESNVQKYSDKVVYGLANESVQKGDYTEAYYSYVRLGDYEDSEERAVEIFDNHKEDFYQQAIKNYEKATEYDLQFAKSQFEQLGDYEDTKTYLEKISFMECMTGTYEKEYSSDHKIVISDFCVTEYYLPSDNKSEMKAMPLEYDGELYLVAQEKGSQQCTVYKRNNFGLQLYQYKGRTSYDGTELVNVKRDDNNTSIFKWTSKESEDIKEPQIGMNGEQVKKSTWGEPKKINKSTYSWGTSEQWCYPNYKYIYLDNDVVTAIQE